MRIASAVSDMQGGALYSVPGSPALASMIGNA